MLGEICQGFAGDIVAGAGYYFATYFLESATIDEFNIFMNEMLPLINNIERAVIQHQLAQIRNPADVQFRMTILQQRLNELNTPFIMQPPFDPTIIDPNPHT